MLDFVARDRDSFYEIDHGKFTYKLSDHLPLWLQIKTDISSNLLHQIMDGQRYQQKNRWSPEGLMVDLLSDWGRPPRRINN